MPTNYKIVMKEKDQSGRNIEVIIRADDVNLTGCGNQTCNHSTDYFNFLINAKGAAKDEEGADVTITVAAFPYKEVWYITS